jgi:hypothetical protein
MQKHGDAASVILNDFALCDLQEVVNVPPDHFGFGSNTLGSGTLSPLAIP